MENLLNQIRDIEGLDESVISFWPLAVGWWIILVVCILAYGLGFYLYKRRQAYLRSWRAAALHQLEELETLIEYKANTSHLKTFSEMLRRIVVMRYSRKICAGLEGDQWLTWLYNHDPKRFDWQVHGQLLKALPYAPPGKKIDNALLGKLITATKEWLR